jgi:hypothetical protein
MQQNAVDASDDMLIGIVDGNDDDQPDRRAPATHEFERPPMPKPCLQTPDPMGPSPALGIQHALKLFLRCRMVGVFGALKGRKGTRKRVIPED